MNIQNELLIENMKKRKIDGILWWYEAWDATWQLYDFQMTSAIESHHQANMPEVKIVFENHKIQFVSVLMQTMITNELGECVRVDYHKFEEIYGTRIKRIRRSKIDENLPIYWTLTPLHL